MFFLVFTQNVFKCFSNDNVTSRIIPKYFWGEFLLVWLLLSIKGGCRAIFNFRLNITSCACLLMSGLNLIFHCNAQSWTFSRSSFNCFVDAFTLKTTENSEISIVTGFAVDDESFDKSFIYIKNRSGLKIDP